MSNPVQDQPIARLVEPDHAEIIDVLGPKIQFLTPAETDGPAIAEDGPCVMRGTIPPSVSVPLHSHRDPETFLPISGKIEALVETCGDFKWVRLGPGDVFHVPGGAKHAFRNGEDVPAVITIVSTVRMARFFREIGTAIAADMQPGLPSSDAIGHFLAVADRYGHWNATPEENANFGLTPPL